MIPLTVVCLVIGALVVLYVRQHYRPSFTKERLKRDLKDLHNSDLRKRILDKYEQMGDFRNGLQNEQSQRLTIADLMTTDIASASPATAVTDLGDRMRHHGTRHLVILNDSGRLVGVVSERDVLAGGRTAADIMTERPVTVSASSSIGNAVALILNHRISCLPVMDNDHLCGILTTSDLLMALERIVEYFEQDAGGCSIRQPLKVTAQMDDEPVAQVAG